MGAFGPHVVGVQTDKKGNPMKEQNGTGKVADGVLVCPNCGAEDGSLRRCENCGQTFTGEPIAMNDVKARRDALFARTSTAALVESLRTLDAQLKQAPSPEHRMVFAWTCDELERRFPAASEVVAAAFEAAEMEMERTGEFVDVDYAATLLAAIEAERMASLSRAIVSTLNDPYEEANRRAWVNITRPVEH